MQIGIDLGATKIESVLLDNNGSELHRERVISPKNYKDTIDSIKNVVNIIEKKFQAESKNISTETKSKINKIIKKHE